MEFRFLTASFIIPSEFSADIYRGTPVRCISFLPSSTPFLTTASVLMTQNSNRGRYLLSDVADELPFPSLYIKQGIIPPVRQSGSQNETIDDK